MNKLGRKISLVSSLLTCGLVCIVGGFIPERIFWIQIICFLIGKMAITSSFTIIFVYSGRSFNIKHFLVLKLIYFNKSGDDSNPNAIWRRRSVFNFFKIWSFVGYEDKILSLFRTSISFIPAPFVPLLKFIFDFLPLLVFGVVAFIAGLLAKFLPETLGRKLPDTIEEAERLTSD